jgi:hypothetical protein
MEGGVEVFHGIASILRHSMHIASNVCVCESVCVCVCDIQISLRPI